MPSITERPSPSLFLHFGFGVALASAAFACSSDDKGDGGGDQGTDTNAEDPDGGTDGGGACGSNIDPSARPDRVVVTADWLNGTISVLDYSVLLDCATTRQDALWKEIDLSAYPPGPYQVELTPDGKSALVASASGFFSGSIGALLGSSGAPGGGSVLLVDLDSGDVVTEFQTPQPPMGLAISADGKTAYSANYGDQMVTGDTLTILDLENGTVGQSITIGGRPEQVDLSPDGAYGVVNVASDGTVIVFETADPANTLSTPVMTSTDPSWPFFLEDGSGRIIVTDSMAPTGATIVETSNPAAPTVVEQVSLTTVPYAGAPFADGSGGLVVTTAFGSIDIHAIDTTGANATVAWTTAITDTGGFPLGIGMDETDGVVLIPVPSATSGNTLVVFDLDDKSYRVLDWMDEVGPTYLALESAN